MSRKPQQILIFPFGGNAREALMIIIAQNQIKRQWRILGFVDDNLSLKGKTCCGFLVLGGREILHKYPKAKVIAAPGTDNNYWQRKEIVDSLKIPLERWTTLIHPDIVLANDARIGYNSIIMSGCVISVGVSIGNHCIILPNTVISHDSCVGDYTLIGSNVSVSGNVKIGELCYLGSGARLIQGIKIGNRALVGMGSTVIKSVPAKTVVAGCPAKHIRKVKIVSKSNESGDRNVKS